MSRPPRSPEETLKIRKKILKVSLDIISNDGYPNFSMRKLASKLGLTATTIYQYFLNKDEIYLAVVEQGFQMLYDKMYESINPEDPPETILRNMLYSYIRFGVEESNLYNIMMVWRVPKYYDFLGTAVEEAAHREMETALRVLELAQSCILACDFMDNKSDEDKEDIVLEIICSIHGFISLWNSQVIDYIFSTGKQTISDKRIYRFIDSIINSVGK
ncbi:MAG TPA: TetR/AcrR family transcriptional regulator [Tepidimicrobium sp.]|nr:TetR/AcrR family transcriptional regulator [Tepidimicrobium sp.]